ncbi:fibronectin type III domain-containing protein [Promethearchaeum syntrophicum]|uniref:Fibronectin type III domain-containing protein n=1 Tax=Promethearchaeum syntrophicum TaxID=2594042 RepID=A0A5B9D5H6_9ARCH|nr:fibronectin type III domain-containing protein [Candidatus Prometheoarchaeum syntrophicum]QEE14359.1 Fibronectin type III domain protein [Candidatus Prometheoarchaeum syntrophicum]
MTKNKTKKINVISLIFIIFLTGFHSNTGGMIRLESENTDSQNVLNTPETSLYPYSDMYLERSANSMWHDGDEGGYGGTSVRETLKLNDFCYVMVGLATSGQIGILEIFDYPNFHAVIPQDRATYVTSIKFRFGINTIGVSTIEGITEVYIQSYADDGDQLTSSLITSNLAIGFTHFEVEINDVASLAKINAGEYIKKMRFIFETDFNKPAGQIFMLDYLYLEYNYEYCTPPTAPKSLSVTPGDQQISLNWLTPDSDNGDAVNYYRIYRNINGGSYSLFTTTTSTSYTNIGLTGGTEYGYYITAVNDAGAGPRSDIKTTTAKSIPDKVPDLTAFGKEFTIDLEWGHALPNGDTITQYKIYRKIEGAPSYDTLATVNYPSFTYTDNTAEIATNYQYMVSAVNGIGEGPPSDPVTTSTSADPSVMWNSPDDGDRITYNNNTLSQFNFTYNFNIVDEVNLYFNGVLIEDVTSGENATTVFFAYNDTFDGDVTATLKGLYLGSEVCSESISLSFSKIELDVDNLITHDTKLIGDQLYMIFHDPSGDGSFSTFTESSTVSMGVGMEISEFTAREVIDLSVDFNLFGFEFGASENVWETVENSQGYDFRYEITELSTFSSHIESENADFIGPGKGDIYWGEGMILIYEVREHITTFFNQTVEEIPEIKYGIKRLSKIICNDENAPAEWQAQNPVYNDYTDVIWVEPGVSVDGGTPVANQFSVSSTKSRSSSTTIELDENYALKFGIGSEEINIVMTTSYYAETSLGHTIETAYTIYDDEPTDRIVMDIGIDPLFGTYIFRTSDIFSQTSEPLEAGTFDYVAPVIDTPIIDFDSDKDLLYPTVNDAPELSVVINDEGGIQTSTINYTSDGGATYHYIPLTTGADNYYYGIFPSCFRDTIVEYKVQAWDLEGNSAISAEDSYTIINSPPTCEILYPLGNEELITNPAIVWTGEDADADEISYDLYFNINNEGWLLLEENLTSNTFTWDISEYEESNVILKLVATDTAGGSGEFIMDTSFVIGEPKPGVPGYPTGIVIGCMIFGLLGLVYLRKNNIQK